jgi:hypothetical protein
MDVSAYMIAAAVAQMARDDAATSAFAALDARNQAALVEAAGIPEADLPSFAALTAQEQVLVRRVLGSALGSDDPPADHHRPGPRPDHPDIAIEQTERQAGTRE